MVARFVVAEVVPVRIRLSTPFRWSMEMRERFVVLHGGVGPIPGSDAAKCKRCTCPGSIGEKDRWGCCGYTVDNLCWLHGWEARRSVEEAVMREMRQKRAWRP